MYSKETKESPSFLLYFLVWLLFFFLISRVYYIKVDLTYHGGMIVEKVPNPRFPILFLGFKKRKLNTTLKYK